MLHAFVSPARRPMFEISFPFMLMVPPMDNVVMDSLFDNPNKDARLSAPGVVLVASPPQYPAETKTIIFPCVPSNGSRAYPTIGPAFEAFIATPDEPDVVSGSTTEIPSQSPVQIRRAHAPTPVTEPSPLPSS